MVVGRQLVGGAVAGGIAKGTVELQDLRSQGAPGGGGVALQALGAAGIGPVLSPDGADLARGQQRGIALRLVPFIGIAGPLAVGVAHEQAGFDPLAVEQKMLDEHRANGKIEMALVVDRDPRGAGETKIPLFFRSIRPERLVHVIGDQAGGGQLGSIGLDEAGLAQQGRKGIRRPPGRNQLGDHAVVAEDVDLTVVALGERSDVHAAGGEQPAVVTGIGVEKHSPDVAAAIVAEDEHAPQPGDRAVIDEAAGDRAPFLVGILDQGIGQARRVARDRD